MRAQDGIPFPIVRNEEPRFRIAVEADDVSRHQKFTNLLLNTGSRSSGDVEIPFRARLPSPPELNSRIPAPCSSNPSTDILQYISDRLGYVDAHDESMREPGGHQDGRRGRACIFPRRWRFRRDYGIAKSLPGARGTLPAKITGPGEIDPSKIQTEGLAVSGKSLCCSRRANSMRCMDGTAISSSAGLLRDHRTDLAKGMVENFFFEIEHYGGVLNANRTYYLTRSQPPFLSSMILAVYDAETADGKDGFSMARKGLPICRARLRAMDAATAPGRRHRAFAIFRSRRRPGPGNHGRSQPLLSWRRVFFPGS